MECWLAIHSQLAGTVFYVCAAAAIVLQRLGYLGMSAVPLVASHGAAGDGAGGGADGLSSSEAGLMK